MYKHYKNNSWTHSLAKAGLFSIHASPNLNPKTLKKAVDSASDCGDGSFAFRVLQWAIASDWVLDPCSTAQYLLLPTLTSLAFDRVQLDTFPRVPPDVVVTEVARIQIMSNLDSYLEVLNKILLSSYYQRCNVTCIVLTIKILRIFENYLNRLKLPILTGFLWSWKYPCVISRKYWM